MATTKIITITGANPNTGKLTLDPPSVVISEGDTLVWEISPNTPDITDIIGVIPTNASVKLFPSTSRQPGESTLSVSIVPVWTQTYSITWKDSNGVYHIDDPQITVNV